MACGGAGRPPLWCYASRPWASLQVHHDELRIHPFMSFICSSVQRQSLRDRQRFDHSMFNKVTASGRRAASECVTPRTVVLACHCHFSQESSSKFSKNIRRCGAASCNALKRPSESSRPRAVGTAQKAIAMRHRNLKMLSRLLDREYSFQRVLITRLSTKSRLPCSAMAMQCNEQRTMLSNFCFAFAFYHTKL